MQVSTEEPLPRVVVMTGKAIREAFEEALNREGTSLATWVVLNRVERGVWDSQRNLANDLRIEGPTLTRQLHRMERDGLIMRTRIPSDRRRIRVELTEAGHDLHARIRSKADAFGVAATAGLSARDQATLRRLLARMRAGAEGHVTDER